MEINFKALGITIGVFVVFALLICLMAIFPVIAFAIVALVFVFFVCGFFYIIYDTVRAVIEK